MKYEEFSGELDKPTGFEEFTGTLDSDASPGGGRSADFAAIDPRRVDRPQPPVTQASARTQPKPYKDRREALDDAVNLLEEGYDQGKVAESFLGAGIKFDEIVAHGRKRGSDYFKQQEIAAPDPEVQRMLKRAPAPEPTGQIKNLRSDENIPGGDVALAGAKGVVSGFKMLMSAGGAGSRPTSYAAQALQTADQYLDGLRSAAAVKDDERISKIMDSAKDAEWTEQVAAAAKAFSVAPASLIAQGLGTSVPVILTSLLPGVRESTIARLSAGVVLGAAQGAGSTKESIYDAVKQDMIQAGVPRIEAEERAVAAQSYLGKNKDQIAIGMALGALASSTGVEKIVPINKVSSVLAKSGASRMLAAAEQNAAGRFVIGGLAEAGPEFLQGSAEQVAQNVALQREGRSVPTFQGAVGQGALEGLAGFGSGGLVDAAIGRPLTSAEQAQRELSGLLDGGQFTQDGINAAVANQVRTESVTGRIRPDATVNFTEPNSPTNQAGLTPIVVPVPAGETDVSTTGDAGRSVAVGPIAGSDQLGRGLDAAGLPVGGAGQLPGGGAGATTSGTGAPLATGRGAGQQPAGLTPRPFDRASDQNLLARTEASLGGAENNNADTPAPAEAKEPWLGRRGDGYVTEADALQALPGRQRKHPDLSWQVERMANGKYRLAGYEQQAGGTSFLNNPVVAGVLKDQDVKSRFDLSDVQTYTAPVLDAIAASPDAGVDLVRAVELERQARAGGAPNVMPPSPEPGRATVRRQEAQIDSDRARAQPMEMQGDQKPEPLSWRVAQQKMQAIASGNSVPADRGFLRLFEDEVGAETFSLLQTEATQPFRMTPDQKVTLRVRKEQLDGGQSTKPQTILPPSGKPFTTKQTAAVYAQQNGITGYSTVRMGAGFAIQPTETNLGTQTTQAQQGQSQEQEAAVASAKQFDLDAKQAALPDTVLAELSRNPGAANTRATVQAYLNRMVAAGVMPEVPTLGNPDAESEATINALGNIFGDATGTGQRVVAYSDPGGVNGFAVQGIAFVNTSFDGASVSAPRTVLHELRHVAEQIAKADTKAGRTNTPAQKFTAEMDSIFDDMTDEGKRAYIENFLHKEDLQKITDPAEREAELQRLVSAPLTKSEMVADFLGNRSEDRAFMIDLAKADPKGFEGFVKRWLSVIDNLVAKLRGGKTQGGKESAKVDQYIRDLNKAKMVARDALIAFRKGNLGEQQTDGSADGGGVSASKRDAVSRVDMNFKDVIKRTPELQAAAEKVKAGEMTSAEYDRLVDEVKPVEAYKSAPAPATVQDIRSALTSDKTDRIGVPSKTLKAGDPVGLRLDIPAYANHGTWVVSVHEQEAGYNAGKSIGYEPVAAATDVTFGVVGKAALNIASGKPKATIAVMKGGWKPTTPMQAKTAAQAALKSKDWVQVGMDPERHSYFYDRATMEPVVSADEVIQVGPLVLAKNPTYGDKADFMFSRREADADVMPPKSIDADGIKFSLKQIEQVNDAAEITMDDLVGYTVFPILADLTAAGYVYMGKVLRGGPYYTLLPSNSKAGLIWANDGKGVASIKKKKASRGVIGLIVTMKQDSHATNNTVANIIFRAVEDEIQKGSVAPDDIPKLDAIVRDLAKRTKTKTRKVNGEEVKEVKQVFPQFANFPGFGDRAASEKFLRDMPFEARGLFFEEMKKPTVEDLGLGVIRKVINDTVEPDMRGLNMGDVVMAIRFDPNADTIELGEKTGTPEHDSYRYAIKGEVIGKFRRPISFQNVFVDLVDQRAKAGNTNVTRDYRSLTLKKPEQVITQEIADRVSNEAYQTFKSPAEAKTAVASAAMQWNVIDRPAGAGVKEFLRTARIYGDGSKQWTFDEAKALIKAKKLRIVRLGQTENWFAMEDRGERRVMTHIMVAQPGVRRETLFADMVFQAAANGATHLEVGGVVAEIKDQSAPRPVAPIIQELSAMSDADLVNLGINPNEINRLNGLIEDGGADQFSPTSLLSYSKKQQSPADRIKWRKVSDVKTEIGGLDTLPRHIIPFASFMRTMADKAANGGLTSRDLIKAYTIARSSMNRSAVSTQRVKDAGLVLPENFSEDKIRPEGAFGYWLLSPMGQDYLNAAEVALVNEVAVADAVKVMAPFGTQNALGKDLERAAGGDLHTRLPAMTAAIAKAATGKNAVKDWQDATDNLFGVREAKKGFLGSLLGFGQLPTFDARQINVNVAKESKEDTLRALSSVKARAVVAKLARRMDALSLTMDPQYAPFYQHLVHHAVWDAVGGTETTHQDVMDSMLMASKKQNDQTDTPEFKRWFGDSKVVDAEGKPLVVYHGPSSANPITEFNPDSIGWFAPSKATADTYANSPTIEVYLSIKNPVDVTEEYADDVDQLRWDVQDRKSGWRAQGYDGVKVYDSRYGEYHWIPFEPTQIKSATGNNGEFDPANPDIRFSKRQTDTPAFKRWFGDSKLVDANGDPLLMYTGTSKDKDFTKFNIPKSGAWFTSSPEEASMYAKENDSRDMKYEGGRFVEVNTASRVMPVYVRIENPATLSDEDMQSMRMAGNYKKVQGQIFAKLRAQGYDGVDLGGGVWVVIGDAKQIKSAIGNSGEFDPENPDIRYSRKTIKRQKLVGTNFEMESSGNVDAARIRLQDDALRMKRVIEAVKNKGGTVGEAQNFYDANTLMPGRIQAAIDDFKNDVVRPMLDKAVEYGIDMDELSMYAYAKHAKERNAYIASINPRLPDGGSGMTDAEADSIMQMVGITGDTAKFEELHKMLMAITANTRQVMLSEGLITQDEFDAMTSAYQDYIPLRGFENVDAETGVSRPGIGRGVNIRGAETIRAMGRKSKAGDLIENVIRDYERVINRVEKNDVGKVLLDFVLSNPDPDLWGVDIERTKPSFNKAKGTVQYTKSVEKGEDTIGVKIGGEQVYIKLADKELTRALRQAWKDETSGLERATLYVSGWWNNWMRSVLTKYNPAFALINIPRDALWSGTASALAELGPRGLARYLAAYPKAFMASARKEAGAAGTSNKLFGNQQMDARFAEFRAAGGITGGFFMRTLDDINQDLRNELLLAGASARNPWEAVKSLPPFKLAKLTLRMLEFMGAASENATRFALYEASREMGNSPAKAAILAKDGTTNFNRKGEWGGALNNMYLFFNAGVQGTAQLAKVLQNRNVQGVMAGVAGVGMMLAMYGASTGGEDDDGEAYWDKIPSFVKERNIVIMLPPGDALANGMERVGKRGRYITIPVQYGFNIFPNAGYVLADVLRNQQDPKRGLTPTKAGLHMASVVFGSINPLGGSVNLSEKNDLWLAVLPTIADLPYQISEGINNFGKPSSPEKASWDIRPDSERMFTSQQGSASAKIAKALNELGGGNEAKPGSIMGLETSVTPGTVQTIISATTGGLGTFVEQVATAVMSMTGDDKDLKANKIPFLNKFYGEVDEGANIGKASDRMREVRNKVGELEAQFKVGLSPEIGSEEKRMMMLADAGKDYQKALTEMRKDEIAIIKSDMPEPQKKVIRKQIQEQRDKLATVVNRAYLGTLKEE